MQTGDHRGVHALMGSDDRNVRSWRVAERCGFVLEGVLRQQSLTPDGEPRDMRIYAKTAL